MILFSEMAMIVFSENLSELISYHCFRGFSVSYETSHPFVPMISENNDNSDVNSDVASATLVIRVTFHQVPSGELVRINWAVEAMYVPFPYVHPYSYCYDHP